MKAEREEEEMRQADEREEDAKTNGSSEEEIYETDEIQVTSLIKDLAKTNNFMTS